MLRPGPDWKRIGGRFAGEPTWSETAGEAARLGVASTSSSPDGQSMRSRSTHLGLLDRAAATSWLEFGVSGQHGAQRLQCLQQVALVGLRKLGQQLGQGSALLGQHQYRARHAPGVFR
jgi:hypothetical protein